MELEDGEWRKLESGKVVGGSRSREMVWSQSRLVGVSEGRDKIEEWPADIRRGCFTLKPRHVLGRTDVCFLAP